MENVGTMMVDGQAVVMDGITAKIMKNGQWIVVGVIIGGVLVLLGQYLAKRYNIKCDQDVKAKLEEATKEARKTANHAAGKAEEAMSAAGDAQAAAAQAKEAAQEAKDQSQKAEQDADKEAEKAAQAQAQAQQPQQKKNATTAAKSGHS